MREAKPYKAVFEPELENVEFVNPDDLTVQDPTE